MSCLHCNSKYGLFNKESGCGICGLSFCQKCLKFKCKLPKENKKVKVCSKCYKHQSQEDETISTKMNKIHLDGESSKSPNIVKELHPEDQKLQDRLMKLKDQPKYSPPSEEELKERLKNLKGETKSSGIVYDPQVVDRSSDQEKIDALLNSYASEVKLENNYDPLKNLEERIAKLKETPTNKESQRNENLESQSSEDESEKLAEKIINSIKLPEVSDQQENEEFQSDNEEELPWCILCNEDAEVRCLDCKDLYCSRCFREAHHDWGDEDHTKIKYRRK